MSASAMQGGHNKYDNDFWLYYTKKTTKLLLFSILRHNLLKFITQTGLHCRNYFWSILGKTRCISPLKHRAQQVKITHRTHPLCSTTRFLGQRKSNSLHGKHQHHQ